MSLLLLIILAPFIIYANDYYMYKQSDYKEKSDYTFSQMRSSKGIRGEYRSYNRINQHPIPKKMLTNIYIPTQDGKTTEIDLLMICTKGIYVVEVKNYSGWIFGNANQRMWTQTLKGGKKSQFFNPIWQNKAHISALQFTLNEMRADLFKSWVIMGSQCEMRTKIESSDAHIIHEQGIVTRMAQEITNSQTILTEQDILAYYCKLLPFSKASESTKQAHIAHVQNRKSS